MTIVANGPTTLTRGVPLNVYTAGQSFLPGVFNGKIRTQSLLDDGDSLLVELIGSTTGNTTQDVEVSRIVTKAELNLYITPLEAFSFYRLRVTLQSTSVSPSVSLDFEINRRD